MSRVVRLDYDGLHVQFQGDRIQAIFHMPADEPSASHKRPFDLR